jgi:ATP-dependent exoDNAse (exonuclease V) alpha subunit
MTDKDTAALAAEQAAQAGHQAKAAAANSGKALASAAEETATEVSQTVQQINLSDTLVGFSFGGLALSMSVMSGVVAYRAFRDTFKGLRK